MLDEFKQFTKLLKQTGRMMVGVPDYDTYVEHRRVTHPDQPVMTYEEFFIERQNSRYGGRIGRCC
ncbi:MAG: YbdD/YjiX family protein [Rhodospirillaceae bacterium]|nr:YbdD/YjiX family protein [Rhodospirillaceae bacterium]MEA4837688.1 YbdD/YjiX family protein [Rhodospirillaceae bacterium]